MNRGQTYHRGYEGEERERGILFRQEEHGKGANESLSGGLLSDRVVLPCHPITLLPHGLISLRPSSSLCPSW